MKKIDTRKVHEIVGRYKLEPSLANDIYVEGYQDQVLLSWFLKGVGVKRAVFPIDTVSIDPIILEKYGLSQRSNRDCVIALASEIYRAGVDCTRLLLIIDRDLDDLLPFQLPSPALVRTDVGAMDVYLLHEDALDKISSFTTRVHVSSSAILNNVLNVSRDIYMVRASLRRLRIPARLLDPCSLLTIEDDGLLLFDRGEYLKRVLNSSGFGADFGRVKLDIGDCVAQVAQRHFDIRITVQGHDVLKILAWFLRSLGARADLRAEENLRMMLQMALTPSVLLVWPLFALVAETESC